VVHRLDQQEGNINFFLGTLFHKALEVYYKSLKAGLPRDQAEDTGLDAYQDAYDREVAKMKDQLRFAWQYAEPMWKEAGELGFEMANNYFIQERDNPLLDEVLDVEVRVTIPIKSEKGRRIGWLSVQTDVTGRKDGQFRVVDHKSASRDMPSTQVDQDDQLSAEAFAVWKHTGEFPDEVVYNVAKKKTPVPPRLINKGKALSKAKGQDTTSDLYETAITENGFDRMDYVEHLQWLRDQERAGGRFFRRDVTFRTLDQLESFERNLREEWKDMRAVAASPVRAYPNPSAFNCPSCPVRAICMAIEDGQDYETLIQAGYVIADPRR
jgi:hypothetical protein